VLFALPPRESESSLDAPNRNRRAGNGLARAGAIICASLLSVYFAYAIAAKAARPVSAPDSKPSPNEVKVLDEPADLDGDATTRPTTAPAAGADAPQGLPLSPNAMQVNPDGTFTLNITKDADLVETLRVIGFQSQKSVVPSSQVHGVLPALDLYNVTVREALDAILRVNGYAYKEEGNFIYVYSQKELADMDKASRAMETHLFRLHYTPAANAVVLIKPALSEKGEVAVSTPAVAGIDTGSAANATGSGGTSTVAGGTGGDSHSTEDVLVVKDYAENLEAVGKILKEIDIRPQQILIEATILQATLQENNAFGVNLTAFDGVDFSTLNNTVTGGTTGTQGSAVNDALTGQIINDPLSGPITDKGYIGGSVSGQNGLQFAVVANNIGLFINALEGVTDTVILANPKVLALNKQSGEVLVGEEQGYITTTVSSTTSTQTVDFLQTGTSLSFRPFIGSDGYIRMEIHPEDSSGGINTVGGQNLPFKTTTEVTSNIMVKDGHTIVIGGLFRENNTTTKSQVPVMGNLPLIGNLFGQQTDTTERKEIIILLTPHIIKDEEAYTAASDEEKKIAEKIRIGSRKEMMWTGRERLAECDYEQAIAELHKPNPDRAKALWYLDGATNNNPKFIEAIQLKEDLTGKVVSDVDNSTVRSFVARQILAEKDLTVRTRPSEVPITTSSAKPPPWTPSQSPTTRASFPAAMREPTLSDQAAAAEVTPPGMSTTQATINASAFDANVAPAPISLAPFVPERSVPIWDIQAMADLMARSCQRACDALVRTTHQAIAMAMSKSAPASKTTVTELPADGN
jgi:type IV pilus assembly protein PilQ